MPERQVYILSLHYLPDSTGIAPYAGALAAGLKADDFKVHAYVAHPFYPEWRIRSGYGQWKRTEVIDGVTVQRLRHFVPRPPRGLRRLFSELSFGLRLIFSRIRSESVVVAVSPALFGTALAALRIRFTPRRPGLVIWVQDIYTLGMIETGEGGRFSRLVTTLVEGLVLRAADRVVVIHQRFAEYLARGLKVDPQKITVIRNWTRLEPPPEISRQEAREALGWPTDTFLAVHTGNMGAKQGLGNVVEAARLADEQGAPINFILVGDGGERPGLEESARGIDRLQFVGLLSDADYPYALAAADCLLVNELPGVAAMAAPCKLTSYFNAGRPILAATGSEGITAGEVEQAAAGVVVPAGDPSALLAMALQLCEDGKRAAEYGAAGRRYRTGLLDSGVAVSAFERVVQEVATERERRLARRKC